MTESRPNRSFVTTHWEVVSRVSSLDELERSQAWDTLVKHYFPALVEYTKRDFSVSEEKAADWVQGFILDKILLNEPEEISDTQFSGELLISLPPNSYQMPPKTPCFE